MKFKLITNTRFSARCCLKGNKGFSLIEVMVAVLVTTIGVVGIYALVPHVIKSTAFNYDRFIAIQLAER